MFEHQLFYLLCNRFHTYGDVICTSMHTWILMYVYIYTYNDIICNFLHIQYIHQHIVGELWGLDKYDK